MSIIQKAKDLNMSGTLVFGMPSDGKTTAIIKHIEEAGYNPLWIVFSNADIIAETHPDWDVAMMSNWHTFNELYLQIAQGKIDVSGYQVAVIEGLNYASNLLLDVLLQKSDTKDPRPAYLEMGRKLLGMLSTLRGTFGALYVTMDLQLDDEGEKEFAINRDLYNKTVSLFGRKWYCYSQPRFEGVGEERKMAGIEYLVQTDPTFAVRFRPVSKRD